MIFWCFGSRADKCAAVFGIAMRTAIKFSLVAAALFAFAALWLPPIGSHATSLPAPASSDARGECLSLPSRILGRAVPYCVILPPGYGDTGNRRYPVLYYFHGLGDNEQMFVRSEIGRAHV